MKTTKWYFNKYKEYLSDGEFEEDFVDEKDFHNAMIEYGKEVLQLAAEKAKIVFIPFDEEPWEQRNINRKDIIEVYQDGEDEVYGKDQMFKRDGFEITIDESSILNIINELK